VSLERRHAIMGTESATFSSPGDTPTPSSPSTEEPDRVKTAAYLWCTVIETWGNTLRFALTILVTAVALRQYRHRPHPLGTRAVDAAAGRVASRTAIRSLARASAQARASGSPLVDQCRMGSHDP
jgi:hypothetical protein